MTLDPNENGRLVGVRLAEVCHRGVSLHVVTNFRRRLGIQMGRILTTSGRPFACTRRACSARSDSRQPPLTSPTVEPSVRITVRAPTPP